MSGDSESNNSKILNNTNYLVLNLLRNSNKYEWDSTTTSNKGNVLNFSTHAVDSKLINNLKIINEKNKVINDNKLELLLSYNLNDKIPIENIKNSNLLSLSLSHSLLYYNESFITINYQSIWNNKIRNNKINFNINYTKQTNTRQIWTIENEIKTNFVPTIIYKEDKEEGRYIPTIVISVPINRNRSSKLKLNSAQNKLDTVKNKVDEKQKDKLTKIISFKFGDKTISIILDFVKRKTKNRANNAQ
ncbi:MAG: hypothetical protein ACP5T6_02355 [Candidatus Micrarchaeia archaeon]